MLKPALIICAGAVILWIAVALCGGSAIELLLAAPVITLALGIGVVFCLIPLLLFIELYHWIRGLRTIAHPYLKSVLTGCAMGAIGTVWLLREVNAHGGEGGLVIVVISPFFLGGFLVAGLLVGKLYKVRNAPLLCRKESGSASATRR